MTPLPPPVGLPPPQRSIRALRSTPRWIGAGVTLIVVGAVYYGLTHMDHGGFWYCGSAGRQQRLRHA